MAVKKTLELELKITQSKVKIKNLKKDIDSLDKRTLEYKETVQKLKIEEQKLATAKELNSKSSSDLISSNRSLVKSNQQLATSQKQLAKGSGLADTAAQELGRTVSDLPFGIRGVGNNISQLGSLFTGLIGQAGGVTKAFRALWASLMGPLGLLIGFQAIVALLQTDFLDGIIGVSKAQQRLNDIMKDGAEASSEEVAQLDTLLDIARDLDKTYQDRQEAVEMINKQYPEYLSNIDLENINTKDSIDLIKEQTKRLNLLGIVKAAQSKKSELYAKQLEAETSELIDNTTWYQKLWAGIRGNLLGDMSGAAASLADQAAKEREKNIENIKKEIEELDDFIQGKIDEGGLDAFDVFGGRPKGEELNDTPQVESVNALSPESLARIEGAKLEAKEIERIEKESADSRLAIDRYLNDQKLLYTAQTIGAISQIIGQQTAAGKVLGSAAALINTWVGATEVIRTPSTLPEPVATISKIANVATIVGSGLQAVRNINQTRIPGGVSAGGGANPSNGFTPQFNLIGQGGVNQLAQTLNQDQDPVQAFVVGSDVTTQQELDRSIVSTATIN
jgi:hypothetical protein